MVKNQGDQKTIRQDAISIGLTALAVTISVYLATYDLGVLAIFPAFLAVTGLIMQTFVGKAIGYERTTSLVNIALYTAVSVAALAIASMYSTNNPFGGFTGSISQLSTIDKKLFGVLMAVAEEQFFRGFITSYFTSKVGFMGVIMSAGVFGVFHLAVYGTAASALTYVFLAGVVLSFVAYKTGMISPVMIAHVMNNWWAM